MLDSVIYGASRHGLVLLDVLRAQNEFNVLGFVDDDPSKLDLEIGDLRVLGGREWVIANKSRSIKMILAIGNNDARISLSRELRENGIQFLNAIHPSAVIMSDVSLGDGNLVAAGAIIGVGTSIENDVVINTSASIDHDSLLCNGCYVSPGVKSAGCVTIGQGAFLGLGALIGPGVKIGQNSIIGAGAVVLADIPPGVLAYGSPARVVKKISEPVNWRRILGGER